jgi:hypothetical protein
VKLLRAGHGDETDDKPDEAILPTRRRRPETNRCSDLYRRIKQRRAIMIAGILNAIYRQFLGRPPRYFEPGSKAMIEAVTTTCILLSICVFLAHAFYRMH